MDPDRPSSPTESSHLSNFQIGTSSITLDSPSTPAVVRNGSALAQPRHRSLRPRPADPASASVSSLEPFSPVPHIRKASMKELDNINRRLGPEGVGSRRAEMLKENEKALKTVVEGHDAAVREKFHLEKFVSLLEGWDPEVSLSIFALGFVDPEES